MASNRAVLTGVHFMRGDEACAEGGIACGCRIFGGYPITPATETAERMAERLPEVGGIFIQMEDELASMNLILGASCAGAKAMTSTSGPGFSLMMENYGLGQMMEVPCVIVNVQRGGPSTGLPTLPGQADMMQARWGSHGDYEPIALAPNSVQECFDLTIEAFNLSEKYRLPVFVMTDETVGHMTEKVVIPRAEEIPIVSRERPTCSPEEYQPYRVNGSLIPPMAIAGDGYHIHMTGLTHDERGYPDMSARAQDVLVRRLVAKIKDNARDICRYEERDLEDADVIVVSYGISARVALGAIAQAKKKNIKVGLFRLITVWPFPEWRVRELAERGKPIVVPELNLGQIALEVERVVAGKVPVIPVRHAGGSTHTPQQILEAIERGAK